MYRKILIIRFSSIGDIVLTTPVIRCFAEQLPDVELHFLVKEKFLPAIAGNPHIARFHPYSGNLKELTDRLTAESFDFVVDLQRNFRSRRIVSKLKKPSATFPKLNFKKWLAVNAKINLLPDVHVVDRYFRAVEELQVKNDGKGLDFFPDGNSPMPANTAIPTTGSYVAMVLGGNYETKKIPVRLAVAICDLLTMPVVLLGGPDETEAGEMIRQGSSNQVKNLCGTLDLGGSAEVLKNSLAVVTGDTGLMHMAAAYKKPIVSVWGNTIPQFGMSPYLPADVPQLMAEVKGLSCRPCSKLGYEKCPKKHLNCLLKQDAGAIADFCNAVSNP